MRARLTLGGRRWRGDRTPRWPENAKTKEADPICSAAACRARRRWARSRAACRAQATTGAAPRTRDESDHNETNDDAAQATCAWSRGESRTGHVWSARSRARTIRHGATTSACRRPSSACRPPSTCPGEVSVTFRAPSRTAWTQSRRRAQARPPRTSSTAQRVVAARMDGPLDLRAK